MISFVMACYNSESTIVESIESVLAVNLNIPFELILVDDGSVDGTKEIIERYSEKFKIVRAFFHCRNLGGGAARNTGILAALGDFIFCVDSDDIMPSNIPQLMLNFLLKKGLDGVTIEKSKFFKDDTGTVEYEVTYPSRKVTLEDIVSESPNSIIGNFLYRRSVHSVCGGYPTHHGFDTQGFGWRVVLNGFAVEPCPGSYYFQRLPRTPSYYMREFNKGNLSKNWFFILCEAFYVFNLEARELILSYPYEKYKYNTSVNYILKDLVRGASVFSGVKAKTPNESYELFKESRDSMDMLWCCIYLLSIGKKDRACDYLRIINRDEKVGWVAYIYNDLMLLKNDEQVNFEAFKKREKRLIKSFLKKENRPSDNLKLFLEKACFKMERLFGNVMES